MRQEEHRLQCACVRWFRCQYPQLTPFLFAVPNGGARTRVTGAMLKAEGVLAGVADIVCIPPVVAAPVLFIEMKTDKGRLSESQKEFRDAMTAAGHSYKVCRSIDDFMDSVNSFLKPWIQRIS